MIFAGIFIDLFLAFWLVMQIIGYTKNGFVRSFLGILQYIITYVLAVIFSPVLGEFLSDTLSINETASNILAFIAIALVCYSIFGLLINIIDKFFELPLLNTVNKALGFLLGIVLSLFSLIIICSISTYILTLFEVSVEDIRDHSIIYRFISNFDIFIYLYNA